MSTEYFEDMTNAELEERVKGDRKGIPSDVYEELAAEAKSRMAYIPSAYPEQLGALLGIVIVAEREINYTEAQNGERA